jgi:hypothetical protein
MRLRRTLALSGAVALLAVLALPAFGQSLAGGCTATVNGRSPASMTKSDPLLVDADTPITVSGAVAPAGLALPANQATSELNVYLYTFGFPVPVDNRNETGHSWGGTVEVPSWLTSLASGLYKVEAEATGNPGWTCKADGYVKLGDSGLTAAAAVGAVGVVAGAGAAATSVKPARGPGGGPSPKRPTSPLDPNDPQGIRPKDPQQPPRTIDGSNIDKSAALQANLGFLLFLLLLFVVALFGLGT